MIKIIDNINDYSNLYLINNNSNNLIYTNPNFLLVLEKYLKANFFSIVYEIDSDKYFFLPFFIKDGPFGKVLNSLPYFGSNGSILLNFDNFDKIKIQKIKQLILKFFYNFLKKNDITCATIVTNPFLEDSFIYENFNKHAYTDIRISIFNNLNLVYPNTELLQTFHNVRKRNIKKAISSNIKVIKNKSNFAKNFLIETHQKNMKNINGNYKDKNFFDALFRYLSNNQWDIYLGNLNDRPVAALLLLYNNKIAEYFTPVQINEFKKKQALSLIIYESMQDSKKRGINKWNWGGTWKSQSGVYNYKKKWSNNQTEYKYFCYILNHNINKITKIEIEKFYKGFYFFPFENKDF